jgi:hypothetical protein
LTDRGGGSPRPALRLGSGQGESAEFLRPRFRAFCRGPDRDVVFTAKLSKKLRTRSSSALAEHPRGRGWSHPNRVGSKPRLCSRHIRVPPKLRACKQYIACDHVCQDTKWPNSQKFTDGVHNILNGKELRLEIFFRLGEIGEKSHDQRLELPQPFGLCSFRRCSPRLGSGQAWQAGQARQERRENARKIRYCVLGFWTPCRAYRSRALSLPARGRRIHTDGESRRAVSKTDVTLWGIMPC